MTVHMARSGDHVCQRVAGTWVYGRVDRRLDDEVEVWWAGRHWQVIPVRRLADPHAYGDGRLIWTLTP